VTPGRPPCDGAVRRRSQGGFTLIELILTICISSMIILPLLAWMILAFHSQEVVTTTSSESAGRNQLAVYLARDVGSASLVTVGGSDCVASPAPPGPRPDVVVMSSTGGGATAPRVSYVLTAVDADSSRLVRRTCDTTGTMTDEPNVYRRPLGKYRYTIFYRLLADDAGIEVARVTHGARVKNLGQMPEDD